MRNLIAVGLLCLAVFGFGSAVDQTSQSAAALPTPQTDLSCDNCGCGPRFEALEARVAALEGTATPEPKSQQTLSLGHVRDDGAKVVAINRNLSTGEVSYEWSQPATQGVVSPPQPVRRTLQPVRRCVNGVCRIFWE